MSSPKKNANSQRETKRKRQGKKEHRKQTGFFSSVIFDFLFDSTYQIVTWVCIGGCLAAIALFWGQGDMRRAYWAAVCLVTSIVAMLGLLGDKHFFQGHNQKRAAASEKERPYVFVGNTELDPIATGSVAALHYRIKNTGPVEAIGEIAGWTFLCVESGITELPPYYAQNARQSFRLVPAEWINGHFRSEFVFTQEAVDALNRGEAQIFIYAKLTYWASDKQEPRYTVPICFVYDPNAAGKVSFCPDNITVQQESNRKR